MISLTNTKKFYDPNDLTSQGITHYDFRVGSGKVPSEEELAKWVNLIKDLEKNCAPNEYIGIHCKHGINRTGFMTIYYMC